MNNAAIASGKKLWVVKQNRFNVPIRLAKEVIDSNRLGKIFIVKCDVLWNRYQGYYDDSPWRGVKECEGGSLYTQASHFIDLLVWWFGDIVSAQTNIETQNHQIETEDTGLSVVKFSNNALGSIIWTTCVYNKNYEGSITIIGEKGTIKIGGQYLNKIEYWDVEGYPLPEGIDFSDKPNAYGKYQGTSSNHDKVINAIISQLKGRTHETVDGFEGIRSIKAIELMYKDAK
jgi:predicted dehydrogenase